LTESLTKMSPLVTVLMPVYNGEDFLKQAIESILAQTFIDFEFLIINDGSTDGTARVISKFSDSRIKAINNDENLRLIRTLNKGLDLSKGKYIVRMDADDLSHPDRIRNQVEFMESNPEVGVSGTWNSIIGNRDSKMEYPVDDFNIRYMALYQCPFTHPTVILRTSMLRSARLYFDPKYLHAEDYEFWLRCADHCKFANIGERLLQYRSHDSSVSSANTRIQRDNSITVRHNFFKHHLNLDMSNTDLDLFRRLNYHHHDFTQSEIMALKEILEKIIVRNGESNYLAQDKLKLKIGNQWFNLCLNHPQHGGWIRKTYKNSILSKHGEANTFSNRFKLILKSFLKNS